MLSEGHQVQLYRDILTPQYTILLMTTVDINCAHHPMIPSVEHLRNMFARSRLTAQIYERSERRFVYGQHLVIITSKCLAISQALYKYHGKQ